MKIYLVNILTITTDETTMYDTEVFDSYEAAKSYKNDLVKSWIDDSVSDPDFDVNTEKETAGTFVLSSNRLYPQLTGTVVIDIYITDKVLHRSDEGNGYKINYDPMFGYSIEFDEQIAEELSVIIKSNENSEREFNGLCDEFDEDDKISKWNTSVISFAKWFGEERQSDTDKDGILIIPECVRAETDKIIKEIFDFIEKYKIY